MAASAGRTTRKTGATGANKGKKETVAAARRPEVRLPPLVPYDGEGLEPDGDYDGVRFDGVDLTDASGRGPGSWTAPWTAAPWTARSWHGPASSTRC